MREYCIGKLMESLENENIREIFLNEFPDYYESVRTYKVKAIMEECSAYNPVHAYLINKVRELKKESMPKRKVRKEIPVSAVLGMDGNWVAVTGMDRIKNNATLIVEVEE